MVKKKDIIRVGDKVKILRPNFIYKWGYENNLQTIKNDIAVKHEHSIQAFITKMLDEIEGSNLTQTNRIYPLVSNKYPKNAVYRVASGIAYALVGKNMKDGNRRRLFYCSDPSYKEEFEDPFSLVLTHEAGQIQEVSEVRVVKTGEYYPPEYEYSDWGDCFYDVIPGGLNNSKTHKLLRLDGSENWIEVCDVEKVYEEDSYDRS